MLLNGNSILAVVFVDGESVRILKLKNQVKDSTT